MVDKLLIFVKNSSYTNFFIENLKNKKNILGRGLFRRKGQLVNHEIGLGLSMAIPWLPKLFSEEHPIGGHSYKVLIGTQSAGGADSNRGGRDGNARGPRGPAVAVSSADNNPWPARICAMKWPHVRHFAVAGGGPVTRDVTVMKVRIWPGFWPKSRVGAGFGPRKCARILPRPSDTPNVWFPM